MAVKAKSIVMKQKLPSGSKALDYSQGLDETKNRMKSNMNTVWIKNLLQKRDSEYLRESEAQAKDLNGTLIEEDSREMQFAPESYNEAVRRAMQESDDESLSGGEDDSYNNHMKAYVERLFI